MQGLPPNPGRQEEFLVSRLPVTVICGFVGAGKSTLVQKVVADWRSGPLAVLLHDRSDAGLNPACADQTAWKSSASAKSWRNWSNGASGAPCGRA